MGHPEEKTWTGKFVDKITGADKAEKLIDYAYNAAVKHFEGGNSAASDSSAASHTASSTSNSGTSHT